MNEPILPNRTYLVQRLNTPIKRSGGPLDKAHRVFGGAMMQISEKLWDILDEAFELDYMGAAEFEFGTVPKVLKGMLDDHASLRSNKFVIERKDITENGDRKWGRKQKEVLPDPPTEPVTIYTLCREQHKDGAEKIIRALASGERWDMKEQPRFVDALDPMPDFPSRTAGWFELNNGFFWFISEEMWKRTCEMFNLEAT